MIILASAVLALAACGGGGGSSTPPPVVGTATVSTSLSAATVTVGSDVNVTITLADVGTTAVSGGALTVPLPVGVIHMPAAQVGMPCSSTVYAVGPSGFVLSGLTVPAGATCTNVITITPSTPGTFVFTPTGLTSVTAGTTATLTIN
jgi:hypothetical protein